MRVRAAAFRLTAGDALLLAASVLSLTASCVVVSSKKHFWNDELFSWYLVADPSFLRMWRAFSDEINNTPPLYFVLGWVWARIFGASELSLRLFSSFAFSAAIVLVWATLRRVYSFWPSWIGTLVVFLTSSIVLIQNAESRMYGLFVALCAGAVYQYASLDAQDRCTLPRLAGVALLHAAIVNTHLFGPFFSAAALLAYAVGDRQRRRLRRGIYVAIVLAWLSLLLYLPAFMVQVQAGRPRAWLPIPVRGDVTGLVTLASASFVDVTFIALLLLCLAVIAVLAGRRQGDAGGPAAPPGESALLVIAVAFLGVPLVAWLISRLFKPIFWDRYLAPTIISYCIVVAYVTARCLQMRGGSFRSVTYLTSRALLAAFVLALVINPLQFARHHGRISRPGSEDGRFGYRDLPMVMEGSAGFLERLHYAPDAARYYFVLDERAGLSRESGVFGAQQYRHMVALKRNYPDTLGKQILKSQTFLDRFPRFLVLQSSDRACPDQVFGLEHAREWKGMHCPQWLEMRLRNNPDYTITRLGDLWTSTVFLVVDNRRSSTGDHPSGAATRP